MLNLSTIAPSMTKVGYSVIRRRDRTVWNPNLGMFVPPPDKALPQTNLTESTAPHLGLYAGTIPDDKTRTWTDGIYEVWFSNIDTGTTFDGYCVRMVRGDDTPTPFQCFADPVAPSPVVPTLTNGWFITPSLYAKACVAEPPEGWKRTAPAWHAANGCPGCEQNPPAPDEGQFVLLEGSGSIVQAIPGWPAGTYAIYFKFAKRASSGTHRLAVQIDGKAIATYTVNKPEWLGLLTPTFEATEGEHAIGFAGGSDADPKAATLVDRVTLMRVS